MTEVLRRPGASLDDLDRTADEVMHRVARTFWLASRFLPADVRADVRRLYLVLRTLDDLVDEARPEAPGRIEAVERWAAGDGVASEEASVLDGLADRHPAMPLDAVADFCAGMRVDLAGPRHATDDDMARYCYQVAGTVGRLMASVLGVRSGDAAAADRAARRLGCAMQRTNILRDVIEDAALGRVYLPLDALAAAGIAEAEAAAQLRELAAWPRDRRRALLEPLVARADVEFEAGLGGTSHLRSGALAIRVAGRLYREILRQIERDAFGGAGRSVVSRPRKAAIVAMTIADRG